LCIDVNVETLNNHEIHTQDQRDA